MCDADGELFIKPCTQAEVDFYQSAAQGHPEFAAIMPTYIGMLELTDTTDEAHIHAQIPSLVEQADIPAHLKEEIQSHLHLEDREVMGSTSQSHANMHSQPISSHQTMPSQSMPSQPTSSQFHYMSQDQVSSTPLSVLS